MPIRTYNIIHQSLTVDFTHKSNPHLTADRSLPDINGIEQVQLVKLLGVTFKHNLKMDSHISNIMKNCSQRLY